MQPGSRSPESRLNLLKSLSDRVTSATEHFGIETEPRAGKKNAPPLDSLIPLAERLRVGSQSCLRIGTEASLTGGRTPQGYACPAVEFRNEPPMAIQFGSSLAALMRDQRWKGIDPEKIAFIDTETTSLAGGTGTFIFLIGIGFFRGERFVVNQYFVEDYSEEEAMIEAVSAELRRFEAAASYNGRCFDLPLMEARWRMQRRRPQFPELHLDLLHPSRRLWKLRLPNCRLGTVEREILGVLRVSDVNSALIPQIYFEYLRGVGRERMLPVIDHHAQDIYSLGALTWAIVQAIRNPRDPRFCHASDQWGLAQIFHHTGEHDRAAACLESAIHATRDEDFGFRLSMHLAKKLVRMGRVAEAVEIWGARAAQARIDRLEPLIELAKHAEHRLRDFAEARRWTERALGVISCHEELSDWIGSGLPTLAELRQIERDALAHRLDRIKTRQIRRGQATGQQPFGIEANPPAN